MPEKKHNFTATEFKAGLLVIVSAIALAAFIAAIEGLRPPEETRTYYAYFSDTSGLNRGADVRFGGSKVGRVSAISLDPEDQSRLRVEANVKAGVPVNEASEAHITQTTLTAEMHLEISTGEKDAPLVEDGAVIPSEAGGLFDKAGELADSVKGVLEDVGDLLGVEDAKEQEKNGEGELVTMATIFGGLDSAVKEGEGLVGDVRGVISERKGDIEAILTKVQEAEDAVKQLLDDVNAVVADNRGNIEGTLADVRGIVGDVRPIIERVGKVSGQLDAIADSLQDTLDNTERLTGEAGGLLEANRPVIEEIVLDLRDTVRYLKDFSRTMAEQPHAVVRGKSPEGRR
ncbi:MAG: MCE family protein [Nitrospiraceae bacterium]|nr:MCE family protein [Nitrospiraceae bacterium]